MIEEDFLIPPKYTVSSPYTSPEYYTDTVKTIPRNIKGLYIPADISYPPRIVENEFSEAIETLFGNSDYRSLPIPEYCHMYFDPHLQYGFYYPNVIATQMFRQYFLQAGSRLVDVVYGDVLLYGAYNHTKKILDNINNSVPYEIVEQVVRLYEAHTAPKPQRNKTQVY